MLEVNQIDIFVKNSIPQLQMAHKRKGKKKLKEKVDYHQPLFIEDIDESCFRPVIGVKNSYLYPEDGIGKMETGVVSKTEAKQEENPNRIVHVLELD